MNTNKSNFEQIVNKLSEEFTKFGIIDPDWFEESPDEISVQWAWTNKLGENEYLTLKFNSNDNNATYEEIFDDGVFGDIGDLNLEDTESTTNMLIQKFIYDETYGGIGCSN